MIPASHSAALSASQTPGGSPEARLLDLGLTLPAPAAPVAAYVPTRLVGNLLVVSGQIPFKDGVLMATGVVPTEVSVVVAQACARQCVFNGLAAARAALGTLDRVVGVVRVGCFVACPPSPSASPEGGGAAFTEHSKVANGASEVLVEVFGEAGRHARAAVGCPSLPLGAPVEVEMMLEVR